jgi:hypothetical protein
MTRRRSEYLISPLAASHPGPPAAVGDHGADLVDAGGVQRAQRRRDRGAAEAVALCPGSVATGSM